MKKAIIFIALVATGLLSAQNNEWHVAPHGMDDYTLTSALGGTSLANAWTLREALENTYGLIKPGDVVWLHEGTYKGHFTCSLNGDAANDKYIRVASYPGGARAVINGNIFDSSDGYFPPVGMDMIHTLFVTGAYVQFENFEITSLGSFGRLNDPACTPNNNFHGFTGIEHRPSVISKCKFVNLLIRNIPGIAIGSWKASADSEIYGCIMYYNGTITTTRTNCSLGLINDNSANTNVLGYSHCIYTQNDTDKTRVIKNNYFMNNYATGVAVWSSTGQGDYLRNYDISQNVFLNNGSPVLDETPGLEIKSGEDSNIRPSDILVKDNLMYINSTCCQNGGPIISKTDDVELTGNYIWGGTNGMVFDATSKRVKFHHNTYTGKHIMAYLTPADYNQAGNHWSMYANDYYIRTNLVPGGKFFDTPDAGTNNMTLSEFTTAYSTAGNIAEENSTYHCFGTGSCTTLPQQNWIRQNQYNPYLFYVSVYNPAGATSLNVDFGNYTIPNNMSFTVRDAENYFVPIVVTGGNNYNATAHAINLPMNLTAIETIMPDNAGPNGPSYTQNAADLTDGRPKHSNTDFRNFIIEFQCKLPFDLDINNQNNIGTYGYKAQNNITFGPAYVASSSSTIDAMAGRQVRLLPGTAIQPGSAFHAWISHAICPDISPLFEELKNGGASSDSQKEAKASGLYSFAVYPNPSAGWFTVESDSARIKIVTVIHTQTARTVFEHSDGGAHQVSVDLAKATPGVYIVKVTFENGETQYKNIVKQ